MNAIDFPLVLDGGLSNVLESYGCDLNQALWSSLLLKTDPEHIIQAHLDYLRAGAHCITTASYQATIQGFLKLGLEETEAKALLLRSVLLAEEARDIFLRRHDPPYRIFIAISLGPYGAMLADGSEYRGHYGVPDSTLTDFHKKRMQVFESSRADFLAFETIPGFQETKVLSSLLKKTQKPSWVSFSCSDELHLNDGSGICETASLLADVEAVVAIGVNCTAPKFISKIIPQLKEAVPGKRIIVYPNSGEVYHAQSKSWSGISDPSSFVKMAAEWRQQGADTIGGCCRIGPDHIALIRNLT